MASITEPQSSTAAATSDMNIQVYNTLTRRKEPLSPVNPGKIGIYLCGPTVYAEAHIGHMVGPVVFDTIKRYLTYCGYDVNWVVNITDVDDKLINKASERGISMAEVAEENIADYLSNLAGMGVDQIDEMPKATEHMAGIIDFVQDLVEKGFAYEADGDVFFDVGKDPDYGKLTNRTLDNLQGDGGGAAAKKRSSADFALWKAAKPNEPSWESPWGAGRPGWHIECSAMSKAILGETFDIHGGGLDLTFPHHENEIAQSECCHDKPMAKIWMHNGLLKRDAKGKVGGRGDRSEDTGHESGKMSRSGGAGGLADLITNQGGERIRFFLLRTHYRSTVLFSDEAIEEAGIGLDSFYRFFQRYERITGDSFYDVKAATKRDETKIEAGGDGLLTEVAKRRESFISKMDDDFNTGAAISDLFELNRALNKFVDSENLEDNDKRTVAALTAFKQGVSVLRELTITLGLFINPIEEAGDGDGLADELMQLLIRMRADARANKDFATADRIRDELVAIGITLEDLKDGTVWQRS